MKKGLDIFSAICYNSVYHGKEGSTKMSKIRKTLWISSEIETKLRKMAFDDNIFQSVIAEEAIEELYQKKYGGSYVQKTKSSRAKKSDF